MTKYNLTNLVTDAVLNKKSYFSVVIPEESVNFVFDPETQNITNFVMNGTSTHTLTDSETCYGTYSIYIDSFNLNDKLEYTSLIPLENNEHYTFSVSIKGRGKVALYIVDSTDVMIGGKTVVDTYKFWNRYSHTILCIQNHNLLSAPPYTNAKLVIECLEGGIELYISGYQLEPKSYATTFLSGNLKGIQPLNDNSYIWAGQPNKSMSIRLANTNTGGRVISFEEMGFDINTIEGLLLPEFDHNIQELLDNFTILYNGSSIKSREFTLGGFITGKNIYTYLSRLNQLSNAFNPSTNRNQQPIKLLLQLYNCDTPISEVMEILCLYNGGIEEFNSTNGMAASIDFTMFTPFIYDSKFNAKHLTLSTSSSGTPIVRDQNGNWNSFSTNNVKTLVVGQDNLIWAGVSSFFNSRRLLVRLAGSTWVNMCLCQTGTTGTVHAIHRSRDGNYLYIGGQFGGLIHPAIPANSAEVTPASDGDMNIGRYDVATDTFEYIGKTNSNGTVLTIEELLTGEIIIGGDFTSITSIASVTTTTDNIAVFNPSDNTWAAFCQDGVGTYGIGGSSATIRIIKFDVFRQKLWVGGTFTATFNGGGLLLDNIVSFSDGEYLKYPEAQADYRTEGLNDTVYAIAIDSKGTLYIGGKFTAGEDYYVFGSGTYTTEDFNNKLFTPTIARLYEKYKDFWRWEFIGGTFRTNDAIVPALWGTVYSLTVDGNDNLWIGGIFDLVTDYANPNFNVDAADALTEHSHNTNGLSVFSNNQWIAQPGISLNYNYSAPYYQTNSVNALVSGKLGVKYNVFSGTGTGFLETDYLSVIGVSTENSRPFSYTPSTFIELPESAIVCKPIIEIVGPGNLISIENATTGQIIYFNKYVELYETLIIDLSGILPSIYSTIYGFQNLNIIRNGSVLKKFVLHAGRNNFFIRFNPNTTTGDTSVVIKWQNRYLSFDNIIDL